MELIYDGGILLLLLSCMLCDLHTRKIPNILVLVLLIYGVLIRIGRWGFLYLRYSNEIAAWYGSDASFLWSIVRSLLWGGILPLAILFPLYMLRVIGAGDVKLLTVLGIVRGWPGCLQFFEYTAMWAAGISLYCMLRKGIVKERLACLFRYIQDVMLTRKLRVYAEGADQASGCLPVTVPIFLGELTCLILKGGLR